MLEISKMVKSMLTKYINARSSDEILLDCIVTHYFQGDYILFMEQRPVHFITAMTRYRRKLQQQGKYEANKKVKEARKRHSKYRADEFRTNKKQIQDISLLKTQKRGKK